MMPPPGEGGELVLTRTDPAAQRDPDLAVARRIDPADAARVHAAVHALDLGDERQRRLTRRAAHRCGRVEGGRDVEDAAAGDSHAYVGGQVPYVRQRQQRRSRHLQRPE
jgi:hypothetical protein